MIHHGEWTDEKQQQLSSRIEKEVVAVFKQAESIGTLAEGPHDDPATMFDDVYAKLPWHLRNQREELNDE